uniref:Uncharacterized protein n=1 Tax=Parascaris equorum TaxID=6256 RepID=A0A914RMY5_PAREQ
MVNTPIYFAFIIVVDSHRMRIISFLVIMSIDAMEFAIFEF